MNQCSWGWYLWKYLPSAVALSRTYNCTEFHFFLCTALTWHLLLRYFILPPILPSILSSTYHLKSLPGRFSCNTGGVCIHIPGRAAYFLERDSCSLRLFHILWHVLKVQFQQLWHDCSSSLGRTGNFHYNKLLKEWK